jgi:hypothetical protein
LERERGRRSTAISAHTNICKIPRKNTNTKKSLEKKQKFDIRDQTHMATVSILVGCPALVASKVVVDAVAFTVDAPAVG